MHTPADAKASGVQFPSAPLTYEEFRTGYTFADVYHMIWTRKHKRRRGVLGYWRELKLKMYAEYLRGFHEVGTYTPDEEPIPW